MSKPWISPDDAPEYEPGVGYRPEWEHPDFNPRGFRECFKTDHGWISAGWCDEQDTYVTVGGETPQLWAPFPEL